MTDELLQTFKLLIFTDACKFTDDFIFTDMRKFTDYFLQPICKYEVISELQMCVKSSLSISVDEFFTHTFLFKLFQCL